MNQDKEIKGMMFRTEKENIDLIDGILERSKNVKAVESNMSRNQFIENILLECIYNSEARIIDYRGKKRSFLEIKEVKEFILESIEKYGLELKQHFVKDNHLNQYNSGVDTTGFLCVYAFVEGIIIRGNDINGERGFFINYQILKQTLLTYIDMNEVDIPINLKDLILDDLLNKMAIYYKGEDIFEQIPENSEVKKEDRFYKFERYQLTDEKVGKIDTIDIILYRESEDGFINEIEYEVKMKNGDIRESDVITDLKSKDVTEVLGYLSSELGFDVNKFNPSITEEIYED